MTQKRLLYSGCTIEYGFKRIGGKYKGRIIWYINSHGVLRFGELKRMIAGITTKMLTSTLRELEEDGLIHREVYHQVPPKVEYTLTDSGKELLPLIAQVITWAEKLMKKDPAMKSYKDWKP
jgi:DNA-binding HxlR family transcriptional regulator